MSYQIIASEDGTYIVLTVKGDIARATAMQHNVEAHALGKRLGIRNYLMDLTEARNTESVTDGYEFVHRDMRAAPDIDLTARVAMLVAPGDHSHDFIETVSKNAGLDVTIFHDAPSALAHLGCDPVPSKTDSGEDK